MVVFLSFASVDRTSHLYPNCRNCAVRYIWDDVVVFQRITCLLRKCAHTFSVFVCVLEYSTLSFSSFVFVEHDSIFHYSICACFFLLLFFHSLFNRVNGVIALDTHVLLVVVVRFARVLVNYGLIWKLDNKIHKVHQCEQAII